MDKEASHFISWTRKVRKHGEFINALTKKSSCLLINEQKCGGILRVF